MEIAAGPIGLNNEPIILEIIEQRFELRLRRDAISYTKFPLALNLRARLPGYSRRIAVARSPETRRGIKAAGASAGIAGTGVRMRAAGGGAVEGRGARRSAAPGFYSIPTGRSPRYPPAICSSSTLHVDANVPRLSTRSRLRAGAEAPGLNPSPPPAPRDRLSLCSIDGVILSRCAMLIFIGQTRTCR
jgi:hypothetical protein